MSSTSRRFLPAAPGLKRARRLSADALARAHALMSSTSRRRASSTVPVTAPTRSMSSRKSGFASVAQARLTTSRKSALPAPIVSARLT